MTDFTKVYLSPNENDDKKQNSITRQVVESLARNALTVSTSTSTSAALYGAGLIVLTGASSTAWQLADPLSQGQRVVLFNSSTTSTANTVTPVSATISATESTAGRASKIVFNAAPASIELTAQSTSIWLATARSGSLVCT